MTLPVSVISLMTRFNLSSNSPRYFVPAISCPRSSVTTLLSVSTSGTLLPTIFCASPSTIAVLPTPGSPIKTGLFLVLLESICMTLSISISRPMTLSSLFFLARTVRSLPNSSRVGVFLVISFF